MALLRRSLRGLGRAHGPVGPEHHGHLRPGGAGLGIEAVVLPAAEDAAALGPVHRLAGPRGDAALIGEGGAGLGLRAARVPPEDNGDLLPAHRVIGAEESAAVAADDPFLGGPQDGVGVPSVRLGVGKGIAAGDGRAVRRPVQGLGQHGPGHSAAGGKLGVRGAAHQAVVPDVLHRLGVPAPGVHVGVAGVLHRGQGTEIQTGNQGQGQKRGPHAFEIAHCLVLLT